MKKQITTRDLTKVGFTKNEKYDVKDDGNNFKGYSYKNLGMTYLKTGGMYYLSFEPYELVEANQVNGNDWRASNECKLGDEFNGVEEVDVEKLVENAEAIIAKIESLKDTKQIANPKTVRDAVAKYYEHNDNSSINEIEIICGDSNFTVDVNTDGSYRLIKAFFDEYLTKCDVICGTLILSIS